MQVAEISSALASFQDATLRARWHAGTLDEAYVYGDLRRSESKENATPTPYDDLLDDLLVSVDGAAEGTSEALEELVVTLGHVRRFYAKAVRHADGMMMAVL